jgi:hypothetical protein
MTGSPCCSFCGSPSDQAGVLVEGEAADQPVYICGVCIKSCGEVHQQETVHRSRTMNEPMRRIEAVDSDEATILPFSADLRK